MSKFKDGKGGGKGKFKIPPQSKAIRRKRRTPQLFANYDVSPTDLGLDPTTITATGSQTYTVPKGVDRLTVEMVGGGGGGGKRAKSATAHGGGGGSGAKVVVTLAEVTPGAVLRS